MEQAPIILDGKALAREVRNGLKPRVQKLKDNGVHPRIEAVVASQDPASIAYVNMKSKWASWVGIESGSFAVDESVDQNQLIDKIREFNEDPKVNGVLVQHPLPKHVNEEEVLQTLGAEKDVDGITPESLGLLVSGMHGFRCATPLGITKILDHYKIECEGKQALVIGRSVILGKPMALMLLEKNATVTVAHSRTKDLPELCRQADILVAAVGRAEMVKGDWLKPGAVVIDAGYNKVEGRTHDVGDCCYESCSKVASAITPVPGGVGPMTVASLLCNTVLAAEIQSGLGSS